MLIALPVCAKPVLKFGVLAFRPKEQVLEQWRPLASYLEKKLERNVKITPYSYSELDSAIAQNEVDVVITNPAHYILHIHRSYLSAPLVTLITRHEEHQLSVFGGVIFTRSNTSGINALSDLAGKRIAVTKLGSLGGYRMQAYELLIAGFPQLDKNKLLITGMPHDNIVAAVLSNNADIGFVRTGVLESLSNEGKINLNSIRIINQQALLTYPFITSTRLYPEWPVAIMPKVDNELARQLTVALLSLPPKHIASIKANINGFTIPATYSEVEKLLRSLRAEPFDIVPEVTMLELWNTYKNKVIIAVLLVLSIIMIGIRLAIQKKQIQQSKNSILLSQQQLVTVLKGAKLGYWDWCYETGKHIVNDQWLSMLGLSRNQIKEDVSDWNNFIHPEDKQKVKNIIQAHIKNKTHFIVEYRMKHTDGHWVWIQGSGSVVEHDKQTGEPIRLCGTHQDITLRKLLEEKTRLSSRVFSDSHECIIITDTRGLIIDVNPAFYKVTGYCREEVLAKNPKILSYGKQTPSFYQKMWYEINKHGYWQGEVWNRKKNGETYAVLMSISSIKDLNQNITNYMSISTEITHTKRQQEKLELMAHYDVLTKLPNRALFVDRFNQAIAHSKRSQCLLGVCFLDLDNFKPINDGYGHGVGDQLLIKVAKRIQRAIREEDTVSRQGGDEFALLLNNIESVDQCEQILSRIHHCLAQPYIIEGYSHSITASSGVTLYPLDESDIDTLMRHADHAMYQAKLSGKHRYQLFNLEEDKGIIQKNLQLNEIEQALANNEFKLYYQPKVNMMTGNVFGAEALIRWIHPEKGLIPPLDFLPFIESTPLEAKVGNWVLNEAIVQLEKWQQQNIQLEVSVNISSQYLLSSTFITDLDALLDQHPTVDSQCLQLEILESSVLGELSSITEIIEYCQNSFGVKVALDDFGTGYSSLTHLRSLPVDTIKIDQSFVKSMIDIPHDFTIIDGIIGLADSFGIKVIAEGVESTEHGLMLVIMGCEDAQGYEIAKPMPIDQFIQWLHHYQPNKSWTDCGSKYRTRRQNKGKLYRLAAENWKNKFINNLNSSPEDITHWPIMDSKHCHCGLWIKRAVREELFETEGVKQLFQFHEKLHQIAQYLQQEHLSGHIDAAREELSNFHTIVDEMNSVMTELEKTG